MTAPLQLFLLSSCRYIVWRYSIWRQGVLTLVVVGLAEQACLRARQLTGEGGCLYRVLGLKVEDGAMPERTEFPVLGTFDELAVALDNSKPRAVYSVTASPWNSG